MIKCFLSFILFCGFNVFFGYFCRLNAFVYLGRAKMQPGKNKLDKRRVCRKPLNMVPQLYKGFTTESPIIYTVADFLTKVILAKKLPENVLSYK